MRCQKKVLESSAELLADRAQITELTTNAKLRSGTSNKTAHTQLSHVTRATARCSGCHECKIYIGIVVVVVVVWDFGLLLSEQPYQKEHHTWTIVVRMVQARAR